MPKRKNEKLNKLFWDKNKGRWRHRTKKSSSRRPPLASDGTMSAVINEELKPRIQRMQRATDQLIKKVIDLSTWQRRIARETKRSHKSLFLIGRGNPRKLTEKEEATVNKTILRDLGRIKAVGNQLRQGRLSDRQLQNWTKGLAKGTASSYSRSNLLYRGFSGDKYGARILGRCADHCDECVAYANRGIVPISQMIPIGVACTCRQNCCCRNVTGSRVQVRAILNNALSDSLPLFKKVA